jgi:hypothetical protein
MKRENFGEVETPLLIKYVKNDVKGRKSGDKFSEYKKNPKTILFNNFVLPIISTSLILEEDNISNSPATNKLNSKSSKLILKPAYTNLKVLKLKVKLINYLKLMIQVLMSVMMSLLKVVLIMKCQMIILKKQKSKQIC